MFYAVYRLETGKYGLLPAGSGPVPVENKADKLITFSEGWLLGFVTDSTLVMGGVRNRNMRNARYPSSLNLGMLIEFGPNKGRAIPFWVAVTEPVSVGDEQRGVLTLRNAGGRPSAPYKSSFGEGVTLLGCLSVDVVADCLGGVRPCEGMEISDPELIRQMRQALGVTGE